MFKNYLKIAFRNFMNDWLYSSINVIGLSIALASTILIFGYVLFQYSFDAFHTNKENIYRHNFRFRLNGIDRPHNIRSYPMHGPWMKEEFPEVTDYVRYLPNHGNDVFTIKKEDSGSKITYQDIEPNYGDASMFSVFDFKLLYGDVSVILREPNTIVLSEKIVERFFGTGWTPAEVIGHAIELANPDTTRILYVQGIYEDIPDNSHINFDCLISLTTIHPDYNVQFSPMRQVTYLLLAEGSDIANLEEKMMALYRNRFGEEWKNTFNISKIQIFLQALGDIQLGSKDYKGDSDSPNRGEKITVDFVFILGFLICFIAWANYVNITTARSIKRAREIGIRKISGATRLQLVKQFLMESFLLNFIALLIGTTLVQLSLPLFSSITNLEQSPLHFIGINSYAFLTLFFLAGAIISDVIRDCLSPEKRL